MNHINLDGQGEAIKPFFLSLPVDPEGAVMGSRVPATDADTRLHDSRIRSGVGSARFDSNSTI